MDNKYSPIEFKQLTEEWKIALKDFLHAIEENNDDQYFHPHKFSGSILDNLCENQGEDLYYVAVESKKVIAYGLLRGWDEGYKVPSLGLAIHPDYRGIGLATSFIFFLHIAARLKGALQIRLKVYPENKRAMKLYKSIGYVFEGVENKQMVGIFDLG
jgi:[ribosomal protein S18]-alanine N-acetyltransferase